jgi:hypothetical protein
MDDQYNFVKRLIYLPTDDYGQLMVQPIHLNSQAIDKLASRQNLLDKVSSFISNIKPDPQYRHVLINALGSGEHWGSNKNGDYFPEEALMHEGDDYGYKTFLKAGAYKHHINKDITKSAGKVVLAEYHPKMHRVELIVKFGHDKDPDLIKMVDEGHLFPVSMGCKVPSDFCSICGHESKTVADYCDDLSNGGMNEIRSDGKIACALNLKPKFFDISRVIIGADRTARSYGKIASADSYPSWFFMPSGLVAEKLGDVKGAAINKEIVTMAEPLEEEKALKDFVANADVLDTALEPIANADLKKAANFDLDESLSSFAALGIKLRPADFQYMLLTKMGKENIADTLQKMGCSFSAYGSYPDAEAVRNYLTISINKVDPSMLKIASKYIETNSVRFPYLLSRALKVKEAKLSNKGMLLSGINSLNSIAALYSVYQDKLAEFGPQGLKKAEKYIPEVKNLLTDSSTNPFILAGNNTESEKVAAEERQETVKDFVVGCLLSTKYKPSLVVVKNTDSSHMKLASALPMLTPTRISNLHPDTSAWVTVFTVNSVKNRG